MKFKKSMLILILAVFLISIAGVCASDVNDTAVASQENAAIESTDENLITVEDIEPAVSTAANGEILSACDDAIAGAENDLDELRANPGTYSGLSSEIGSGGDIVLTHDYYTYDNGTTIVISIDNSVIDGKGAIIDMAGSNMRAFNVTASGVTIKNLTIRNANAEGNGGAVYFNNTGVVENCNFADNKAEFFGGAVCFGGQGTVTNCNFTDNHATSGFGGAIYFILEGNVTDSNFINNTASGLYAGGGAIYFARDGNVTDCNFTNNKATDDQSFGGAVQIYRKGKLKNCIFVNNAAGDSGGAVLIQGDAEVTNCNFVINSAGYAGALSTFGNSYITYCNFTNNKATDGMSFGGALEFESGKLENSIFVNNSAFRGGAAYFYGNSEVTNCNFTNNKAGENAGALWFVAKSSVENCIFVNNNAKNFGGGILFYKNGEVTNCNFTNNNADVEAGGIYYYTKGEVTNCNFTDNKAGDYAGAVWFNGVGNVTNCSFVRNSASEMYGGGIFFKSDGEVTNCNFVNNNATYGGGIFFYVNGEVTDCNFTNNKVGNTGSGIFFNKNGEVTNCNFINNSAGSYAGAVYFNEGGRLINSNFTDNSAGVYAGAVFIYENGIVENCNFNCNNAPEGGAIRIINNVAVKDCSFNDNNASKGGAVFIRDDGVVTDCNFTNNSAEVYAGAIFIKENGIVENCNFIKNSAKDGGALFINGTAGVTNCNFTDNKVNETQGHGGAILWNGTNGNVSDCSFVNNSGYNGGAICWNGTNGNVSGCSFVNNSATDYGSAILWNGANGNVSDCSFVNNTVEEGGIIYWTGNDGVVSGCVFVNNSAEDGIIYFHNQDSSKRLTINNNIFLNNYDYIIHFDKRDLSSNVDYNWFGNNATDYDMAPATINMIINNWLFLNATANPDSISVFESSDILFKLYSYSEEDDEISDYDNSRLPVVNLTLTSTNGRVNTTKIELGEPVQYTAESGGIGKITATIENTAYTTANIIVKKADVNLTAQDVTVVYTDESGEFVATLTNTVNGKGLVGANVVVSINGEEYTLKTNGKGQVKVSTADLPIGVYTANVSYKGNNRYTPVSANATVTVTKMDTSISVVYEASSNEVVATITCPTTGKGLITANVIVNLDGEEYALKTDGKGQAKVSTADIKSGNYNVTATYKGNHKYKPSNATVEVSVKSATILSVPDVSVVYGDESGELVATLTNNEGKALVTANVIVTLDGVDYALKTNSKGQVKVSTANLTPGTYKATVSYKGNTKYTPTTTTATVTVNKIGTEITAAYNEETNELFATLTNTETGKGIVSANVIVNLDGIDYALKTNSKGQVKVSTAELAPGTYNATASYNGNSKYASSSTNITINK